MASVIELFVLFLMFSLGLLKFFNSLQHNIRLPSRNWDPCDNEFAAGVNLRRHDTLRGTVMNVMTIFL